VRLEKAARGNGQAKLENLERGANGRKLNRRGVHYLYNKVRKKKITIRRKLVREPATA